jgi:hypothetical protein
MANKEGWRKELSKMESYVSRLTEDGELDPDTALSLENTPDFIFAIVIVQILLDGIRQCDLLEVVGGLDQYRKERDELSGWIGLADEHLKTVVSKKDSLRISLELAMSQTALW